MRDKSVGSILFCESVSMAEVSPSLRDKSVGSLLFCYTIFMSGVSASLRDWRIRRWPAEKAIILSAYLDLSSRSLICAALSKNKKTNGKLTECVNLLLKAETRHSSEMTSEKKRFHTTRHVNTSMWSLSLFVACTQSACSESTFGRTLHVSCTVLESCLQDDVGRCSNYARHK